MENKKIIHAVVLCSCFGLVALGAGVAFRSGSQPKTQTPLQGQVEQSEILEIERVNTAKTPTINDTILKSETAKVETKSEEIQEEIQEEISVEIKEEEVKEVVKKETETAVIEEEVALVFAYPSTGEIILPYSVESAIYDPTLDQYRTNNSMSFASREGDPVLASEKGTIKDIVNDEERGNSVIVEHKDGWLTTYSQLAGEMLVAVGDKVEKGQTLALVAQPTKYTVALGEHLEFAIEKDGETHDPKLVVEY